MLTECKSPDEDRARRTTTLDDLELKLHRAFGYWFDFGDDWFRQVQVKRIDQASRSNPFNSSTVVA